MNVIVTYAVRIGTLHIRCTYLNASCSYVPTLFFWIIRHFAEFSESQVPARCVFGITEKNIDVCLL